MEAKQQALNNLRADLARFKDELAKARHRNDTLEFDMWQLAIDRVKQAIQILEASK